LAFSIILPEEGRRGDRSGGKVSPNLYFLNVKEKKEEGKIHPPSLYLQKERLFIF